MNRRLVVYVASPLSAPDPETAAEHRAYAIAAMADSLARLEAPVLPHVMYPLVLDDNDPEQRAAGMKAGMALLDAAELVAVYIDRGISRGMRAEIERANAIGRQVVYRSIRTGAAGPGSGSPGDG